jgi:aspartyl/glutamyl-tRNA(Asn/Gln) amidotransferase C subunit
MEDILKYIDRLQNVDTTGVDEASPEPVKADAFREDEVTACAEAVRAEIIQNFPASQAGLLKAPAVFERPKA